LRGLAPAGKGGAAARLDGAVRALAAARTMAEGDLAKALDVRIGFSDSDGD
ncbi:MAG: hypothetical protein IT304_12915, partial [Dehalococcoidia bacterium]|nr:hypothetical protein [Dehalococcoidia bacterium]